MRAHANVHRAFHQVAQVVLDVGLEVGERDVAVDVESLDLVEAGAVGRVGGVAAVGSARGDNADRRRMIFHVADLHRRGVGAQQGSVFQVKGVLRIARRVDLRGVQRVEVVELILDIGAFGDDEAGGAEDVDAAFDDLADRVFAALRRPHAGQRRVEPLGGDGLLLEGLAAGVDRGLHPDLKLVRGLAKRLFLIGRGVLQRGHDVVDPSVAAEILDAHRFERGGVFRAGRFAGGLFGK